VLAARAKVNSSKAHLASVLATLKEAKLNYDRLAGLENKQIVSKSDLDSALAKRDSMQGAVEEAEANARTSMAQLQRAVAQVKGAEALIGQKEAALKLDQIKLDYCTIRSPIDGTVITREVDVGQTVAATLQSPVLFTIAEDLSRMQVEVDVSEADVGQIEPGQGVEFNVDAFPQNKFRAKVRQVRNVATNIQNVVTYKVIVDVDNDKQILRPGMTANVTILVAKVDDVLKIPNAALRFKPPSEGPMGKPKKASSVRDKEFFKKIVERVGLDSAQADELEKIMKIAGSKLKENLGMPEEERDPKQAWSSFFTEVFTRLHKILRENQFKLFSAYVAEFRALSKKRKMYKGRWTNVYVLDEKGRPKALRIMVGIANDSETQIIHGALHKGDKVIVGIARTAGAARRPSSNILSTMLGRR
jgi:HlyD family secretion protein